MVAGMRTVRCSSLPFDNMLGEDICRDRRMEVSASSRWIESSAWDECQKLGWNRMLLTNEKVFEFGVLYRTAFE